MAVRTIQLGQARNPGANVVATVYTCPAGHTAILKDLRVQIAGTTGFSCWIERSGLSYVVDGRVTGTPTEQRGVALWAVLEPGDILKCLWTTGSVANQLWASGAELEGVA